MSVDLGPFAIGGGQPLVLIAGPCQAESPEAMAAIADTLDQIATGLDLPLIFKASFDKANRTSADAPRGMGLDATLRAFDDIRRKTGRPVLTDV
ncbi:MAG: 3-deoxy-8-phosphooctulonate synthase, partial [Alphaproteobacteria bacterium]